jgi:hypothetical protein
MTIPDWLLEWIGSCPCRIEPLASRRACAAGTFGERLRCLMHAGAKSYEKIQHFAEWQTLLVVEEYDRRIHAHRATAMFTLAGVAPFRLATAANGWHTLADPEKAADGLDELGHRDRLRQIGLATALTDALLVASHRKGASNRSCKSFMLSSLSSTIITVFDISQPSGKPGRRAR